MTTGTRFACAKPALLALAAAFLAACAAGGALRTVGEVQSAMARGDADVEFDVEAKVLLGGRPKVLGFAAQDGTGAAWFGTNPSIAFDCPTNAGDVVRLRGRTVRRKSDSESGADCSSITLVARGKPPEPMPSSAAAVHSGASVANRLVRVGGTVHDIFRDDIDPRWIYVLVCCDDGIVYWSIYAPDTSIDGLDHLIGSAVTADGIATLFKNTRTTIGHILIAHDFSALRPVAAQSSDPYDVPEVDRKSFATPTKPAIVGRRRVTGHVIAVWHGGKSLLLRSGDGDLHRVSLKRGPPPRYGERVEILGLLETDLYRINMTRAIWRPSPGPALAPSPVKELSAAEMFTDAWMENSAGRSLKNASLLGQTVHMRGTMRGMSAAGSGSRRLYLECDSFVVPIDASGCQCAIEGLSAGCVVDVTGTYIVETDNLGAALAFPQVRDILIALRSPGDVSVVSRPPWWTPGRLATLVAALGALLLGIFAWNVALRRRAERRGCELAAEQIARAASELKVEERTRLAVELHDSLSQTLAGVSMGVDSALGLADGNSALSHQLQLTARTIEACRTELKNCLWDLRSQALEEPDMERAIRLALGQVLTSAGLTVRFSVPRSRLSDKTAHAILRIMRELASNSVRHGHATDIRIAGCIEGCRLRFSVSDNGCGFDPDAAPGIRDGHFGLQGIMERVELMDGECRMESSPGKGSKFTVYINVPPAKAEAKGYENGKDQGSPG